MDYRILRIRKCVIIQRVPEKREKICQLDPRISIVNGHKTGNLLREYQSAGVGTWMCVCVKARRIYGWTWRNVVVHEKKRMRHMN